MYERSGQLDSIQHQDFLTWAKGSDPILFNQGRHPDVLASHLRHAEASRLGEMPPIGSYLKSRMADTRIMRCALDRIKTDGGNAPGVDGLRPSDLDDDEGWSLCRTLAKAVREGVYRPGPDRLVQIHKHPGSADTRTLTIQNTPDRIVAGAAQLILQPVLDPMLSPFSFARPQQGAQHALATALALAQRSGSWIWIAEDIKAFYDNIPHSRLMRAVNAWLPDAADTVDFVRLISHTGKKLGVRQGSSLSPLLAHVHRDHHISASWLRQLPGLPLISYLDDLLVPCESVDQAHVAYGTLAQLVTSSGLRLKGNPDSNISRVADGQEVIYLGYRLERRGKRLAFSINDRSWQNLEDDLLLAHEERMPPLSAEAAVKGWLDYLGPCYRDEDRDGVIDRVCATASSFGFDELPSREALMNDWFAAYGRWRRLRESEAEKLDHRLSKLAGASR